ncbi:DUF975 family protein [Streptococcus sp. sy010]|nr:DUF975 family protein [Streptococcus sp. sy010]
MRYDIMKIRQKETTTMMTNKSIRQAARHQLKQTPNKYKIFLTPILLILIYTGIERILFRDDVNSLIFIFIPIMASLFILSASLTMLDIWRKKQMSPTFTDSTRGFSLSFLGKYILVSLLRFIYFIPFIVLFIISSATILFLLYSYTPLGNHIPFLNDIIATFGWGISLIVIFILFALIFLAPWHYAFSQAEFILAEQLALNTYTSPHHVLMTSRRLMKGHRKQAFFLDLSFIGWFILNELTANLLMIYILPYYTTAKVVFYDQLTKHHQS